MCNSFKLSLRSFFELGRVLSTATCLVIAFSFESVQPETADVTAAARELTEGGSEYKSVVDVAQGLWTPAHYIFIYSLLTHSYTGSQCLLWQYSFPSLEVQ